MSKRYIEARDAAPTRMPRRRILRPNRPTVKKLKRKVDILALGQERKHYDTFLHGASVAPQEDWLSCEYNPSATSLVSTPAVGDDAISRDGKKIAVYSLMINGSVQYPARADDTVLSNFGPTVISVVLDKQTNGAALNSEDVFTNPSSGANLPAAPLRNQNFRKRFRVLRTKLIPAPVLNVSYDGTNLETQGKIINFKFFMRFKKPLVINFNSGTTASVASVLDKSIHVLANSTSTTQTLSYNAQLIFVG